MKEAVKTARDLIKTRTEAREALAKKISTAKAEMEGKFQILVIHDFPRLMRGTAKCIKVLDSLSEKHIETYISSFGIPAKELYSFPLAA